MRRQHITRLLCAAVAALLLAGCTTPPVRMDTPGGFAAFSDQDIVRAVSPEGVLVRARSVANEPAQTLEFWSEVLERQLLDSGYLALDSSRFESDAGDGVLFEWLAPVNEDDWIYLTAISVAGERILIVEAAGPAEQYRDYREELLSTLESLGSGDEGSDSGA